MIVNREDSLIVVIDREEMNLSNSDRCFDCAPESKGIKKKLQV
jgi:hypothetical protein